MGSADAVALAKELASAVEKDERRIAVDSMKKRWARGRACEPASVMRVEQVHHDRALVRRVPAARGVCGG